jgi:DNA-binding CsgD family transcriptional regulator
MKPINFLSSKLAALADSRRKALHRFVIYDQEFLITPSRPEKEAPATALYSFSAGGSQCYLVKVETCVEEPGVPDASPPDSRPPALEPLLADHHQPPESPVPPVAPISPSLCSDVASRLTARELQIASLVAMGHSNKQIHRELGISEWTVCSHLRRIFIKLGVDSRAAMVFRCASLLIQNTSENSVS